MPNEFNTFQKFDAGHGRDAFLHSLPALEEQGVGPISRLPVSIRIVLESVLRNCDGKKVSAKDVKTLANWNAKAPANEEIPFVVARIVLQDFTGVPLVVDLAAMRSAGPASWVRSENYRAARASRLVVDHSVMWILRGSGPLPSVSTMDMEFKRNRERYGISKSGGSKAFKTSVLCRRASVSCTR
jgi:aconitate hydratase